MIILLYALAPVITLVLFIFFIDSYQHEPWSQILKGGLFGAISAIGVVTVLSVFNVTFGGGVTGSVADAFFNAAIPEECAKLLMLWLLLKGNKYYDEYFDGIVYAVCVGMGFAGLENILYLVDEESFQAVALARGLFSVPAHALFAVAMGYYYSLATFTPQEQRKGIEMTYIKMLAVPILMHGAYDAFLMMSEHASYSDDGMLMLISVIGFVATCIIMWVMAFKFCKRHKAKDKLYFDWLAEQQINQYWDENNTNNQTPPLPTIPTPPTPPIPPTSFE